MLVQSSSTATRITQVLMNCAMNVEIRTTALSLLKDFHSCQLAVFLIVTARTTLITAVMKLAL
jgi:hypothetical protein